MTPSIDESGQVKRGSAPVSAVSVPNHLGYGDSLVHSLDYVVMLHILFATAAGRRLTPPQLWDELKARGIRSAKNANELVGKNAVYESFARLIKAGYLRRIELPNEKHPGRKGPIAYEAYDNPAWNPDWQEQQVGSDPLEAPREAGSGDGNVRVSMLPGTPEPVKPEAEETAGQNASLNAGTVVQGSGVPGSGKRRIPAGQNASPVPGSVKAFPPHPPEEVETSSPYPLKASTPGREEGASFASNNEDQIQAAYEFLQDLPNPWRAGRTTARKLAPKLAEAASEQGWSLDADLVKKLTEMPEGIKSYPSVLARRVDDLPRRGPSRVPGTQRDRYSDVPERPDQVVPSEEGMATVRAALAAFRGDPGTK